MADLWAFLVACWTTGTLLRSVCALVVIPILAWSAVRLVVPTLSRLDDDPIWQAPLAAAAAAIPGTLLVTLAAIALASGARAACLDTPIGRAIFAVIIFVCAVSLARALILAGRRSAEAALLVSWSAPASERLALIAESCGVTARLIPDARPFCALAGVWRPVVIVSQGALDSLSDRELEAALLHERGHARRGDQLIAAALSFLVDLLPLPAMDLVGTYRRARELAADRHALASTQRHELAGALLLFAKHAPVAVSAAALTGENTARERLRLLLHDVPQPRASLLARSALTIALAGIFTAGLAPAALGFIHPTPCTMGNVAHSTS